MLLLSEGVGWRCGRREASGGGTVSWAECRRRRRVAGGGHQRSCGAARALNEHVSQTPDLTLAAWLCGGGRDDGGRWPGWPPYLRPPFVGVTTAVLAARRTEGVTHTDRHTRRSVFPQCKFHFILLPLYIQRSSLCLHLPHHPPAVECPHPSPPAYSTGRVGDESVEHSSVVRLSFWWPEHEVCLRAFSIPDRLWESGLRAAESAPLLRWNVLRYRTAAPSNLTPGKVRDIC